MKIPFPSLILASITVLSLHTSLLAVDRSCCPAHPTYSRYNPSKIESSKYMSVKEDPVSSNTARSAIMVLIPIVRSEILYCIRIRGGR